MKKLLNSITFLVVFLTFTECDKQLDLQPLGQLDEITYYQNEDDFEAASLSPYSTLLNLYYDQAGQGWYEGAGARRANPRERCPCGPFSRNGSTVS